MTFDEILHRRQSVRVFQDTLIEPAVLTEIAQAGRLAPSAKNGQEWGFVAVTDPQLRASMVEACRGQTFVRGAAAILVVYHTSSRLMSCGQSVASVDASIALTCMMLKATELGLGSCWLGAFSNDMVKDLLKLPEEATVVAVMPLGYPAEEPSRKPRKDLAEIFEIR